jgi:hypothetical protein
MPFPYRMTGIHFQEFRMSCHPIFRLDRAGVVAALLLALSGTCFAFGDKSAMRAYYYFLHSASLGDADQAAAQFADDAVVVAGPLCTHADPCVGRPAIRARYILPLIALHAALPLNGAQFDGRRLRTQGGAPRAPAAPACGWQPVGGHTFEFGDGRITSLRRDAPDCAGETLASPAGYTSTRSIPPSLARST